MNSKEIIKKLRNQPFEPFIIITGAGDRYEVRHPENLKVVPGGTLYVFAPVEDDEETINAGSPVLVSMHQVTSVESSPNTAA